MAYFFSSGGFGYEYAADPWGVFVFGVVVFFQEGAVGDDFLVFCCCKEGGFESVNLFSLSIPAMCLPGIQDEFSAKSIVCFRVVCCV